MPKNITRESFSSYLAVNKHYLHQNVVPVSVPLRLYWWVLFHYITTPLFASSSINRYLVCFHFETIINKAAVSITSTSILCTWMCMALEQILRVKLLGHTIDYVWFHTKMSQTVLWSVWAFLHSTSNVWEYPLFHRSTTGWHQSFWI